MEEVKIERPIRVLHVLHSMNRGGTENALMNYYRNINREKVQFDFLLTNSEKGQFEDEIARLGGRIFKVPLITMSNPFPYLKAVKQFLKEHSEYHIVHSHTSSKSVFPLWVAKQCGVPVRCCHSHSSMAEKGLTGWVRKALMPFLKVTATDFLSCGNQAAVYLYGQKYVDEGKVNVFKNVIETQKYRFDEGTRKEYRSKLGIEDDVILLGHTARFDPVKNHPFDVEILAELLKKGVKAKLLMVGDNIASGIEDVNQKISELRVEDDVIFTGVVDNVYDYEQAMDVFLLPSFNEGLPLSIIEAQVSGLPCFTSKDRVSSECSVTDLVHYLPLEVGAKPWADEILNACMQERCDRWDDVVGAGYDAKTSAKELQEFYIRRYNETN